jgi:CDP-glycerol glycerophosphotransferase
MNFKPMEVFRTPVAYWQGLIYYKFKNWEAADACFKAALEKSPDHAQSLFKIALLRMKEKQWKSAFPYLQKAVFLNPERTDWQGRLKTLESKLSAAEKLRSFLTLEAVQERIDKCGESAFLYNHLARARRKHSQWWLETEALKEAVGLDPENPDFHFRLGYSLAGMKRFEEASIHLERAVDLRPGNPEWYYSLGCALAEPRVDGTVDKQKADLYFDMAVDARKSARKKDLGIGTFHQEAGRWVLAADAFDAQARRDPANARVHFFLGDAWQHLYEWEKAAAAYRTAIRVTSDHPNWHYRLGFVEERRGNLAAAAESYAMAIAISPEPLPLWYYRLGYVLECDGRFIEACDAYRLSSEPLAEASDPETTVVREIDEIQRGLRDDATDPQAWGDLGGLLQDAGRWRDAADCYFQAVSRSSPHVPDWHHRRGCCLAEEGNLEAACACFRAARILQRPYGVSQTQFRTNAGVRTSTSFTEYFETLDVENKKVLYESYHGMQMSCNPYAIFLYLLEDGQHDDWTHVWVINDPKDIPEKFKALQNVLFVSKDSDGYIRHLSTSSVLINNSTFPQYFIRKEGQTYLNTWHGTPWKTLGIDIHNDPLRYGNVARNFLHATHLLSPNPHTTRILLERHCVDHLFTGMVAETGYPRIDLTLNLSTKSKSALRKRLGVDDLKKVVLYAPTWRGTLGKPEDDAAKVEAEINRLMRTGCHLLFRGHMLGIEFPEGICVPEDIPTNELLAIVDLLVTDYSSITFDFLATGRPVLLYLPDLEQYREERGLYFGPEEMPGTVCRTLDELCGSLAKALETDLQPDVKYAAARARFCPHEDGAATRRVVELIFHPQPPTPASADGHRLLFYGGEFQPNGVTTSMLNLLGKLDHSKLSVTLAVQPWNPVLRPDQQERFERLPVAVKVLPRSGSMNLTMEERWVIDLFNTNHMLPGSAELWEIYAQAHAREFVRLYGPASFDAAVEFSGYSSFWASVFAFAPERAIRHRAIYQHNDKHGEWTTRFPQLERVFRLYSRFDRLISVCDATRDLNVNALADLFDLPKGNFDFCDNMLNPPEILERASEALDPAEEAELFGGGRKVFICVARLSVEKDQEKLIKAFARLLETRTDIRLLLVGDGPLLPILKRLVNQLGVEEYVRLIGYRLNPFPYVKRSDCFVLSSNYEGQGLVLFEAMILGKAIISTDIAACRSVVESRSGLLVENSVDGLVRGMQVFLEGGIDIRTVDLDSYQSSALRMFYQKSCGLGNETLEPKHS